MSEYRRIPVRLSFDNPEHLNIINTLDDLNLDVHRSRNSFIINAISFYINAIQNDNLTYADEVRKREMEKNFITRDELEDIMDGYMESIRTELYREMIKILAGVALSPGTNRGPDADAVSMNVQGVTKAAEEETVKGENVEADEDMAVTLSRYDNVLQHVMDWSED